MRMNRPLISPITHEGGKARVITAEQALRRSVLSCLLWEREFYEDGIEIAQRIGALAQQVSPRVLADLAIEARQQYHLRHVPLFLLCHLAQTGKGSRLVSDTIVEVVQRADEMAEFLALYSVVHGKPVKRLTHQMRKGLARVFHRFDEHKLAKYNRDGVVKLRDVLFLTHPKPVDAEQAALWERLASKKLATPDTWEVALSAGADKRETFERLIKEGQLGYLALLRNLRNMMQAGCDRELVAQAILARRNGADKVFPFRFIAAARACPQLEPELDRALISSLDGLPQFTGSTIILVDVSGSMDAKLSVRSDLRRIDAAAGLAAIFPGQCRLFTFSDDLVEVPPRKGMAGIDAIIRSQIHGSTYLGKALGQLNHIERDRLIVITDEQSHDRVHALDGYMINVASNRNGVGYGQWVHLDGFSENVLRWIKEYET